MLQLKDVGFFSLSATTLANFHVQSLTGAQGTLMPAKFVLFFSSDAVTFVRNQLRQHGDVQVWNDVVVHVFFWFLNYYAPRHVLNIKFLLFQLQLACEALAHAALV